ncbi:hypothetical protein HYZ97_00005, partial [Candidatus Pacearchaeota archaeon]|nr:hypothetical protein [Candidatus Pacearchaeota archaeon]
MPKRGFSRTASLIFFALLLIISLVLVVAQESESYTLVYAPGNALEATILNQANSPVITLSVYNYHPVCIPDDCYLYLNITLHTDTLSLLDDIKYYNVQQTSLLSGKQKTYQLWNASASYTESATVEVCDTIQANGTALCHLESNGTEQKQGIWQDIDPSTIQNQGTYQLRIKVDIQPGESLDLVPVSAGLELNEWLIFTGASKVASFDSGDDTDAGTSKTHGYRGQSFLMNTSNATLAGISVKGYKVGTPGIITAVIRSANATGYPSSTNLSTGSFNAED